MHSARTNKLAAAMICGILTLTVPAAMLLIATHPAQAQTEIMLHSFCASGSNCAALCQPLGPPHLGQCWQFLWDDTERRGMGNRNRI